MTRMGRRAIQSHWEVVEPQPDALELAGKMLCEFRRKVRAEAVAMREYAEESHVDEVRRTFRHVADRLDEIIGGAT